MTITIENASLGGAVMRSALYHEMEYLLAQCQALVRNRRAYAAFLTAPHPDEGRRYFERQFWACAAIWSAIFGSVAHMTR